MKYVISTILAILSNTTMAGSFLGFSSDTVQGDAGLFGMNQACVNEFGAEAKFCSSKDIILSPSLTAQTGTAWVRPIIVATGQQNAADGFLSVIDYSGLKVNNNNLSCNGWSVTITPFTGLTIRGANLGFLFGNCTAFNRVACCKASAAYRISPN